MLIAPTKNWISKRTITGIYKITSPSGRIYIGQSWDITSRWRLHISPAKEKRGCPLLQNSFKKYGTKSHLFEVIHILPSDVSQKTLDEYEIIYLNQYREVGFRMMNLKEGGGNGKASEITKQKMSLIRMGNKYGFKKGFTPWNKGQKRTYRTWNTGLTGLRKCTEETKAKMRASHLGKPHSRGYKRPLSAILATAEKNRGKKRTQETKDKIRNNRTNPVNIGKWNIGKIRTEDNKERISNTLRNKTTNKGEGSPNSKLTNIEVLEIRDKYIPRIYPLNRLATEYNISKRVILDIIHRKIWRHI